MRWRREKRRERGEVDCKFTASLGTRTKKLCERQVCHIFMVKS